MSQILTLIVTIILARMLDPESYGKIAIVTTITSLTLVVIDSGLGSSLIQNKNADEIDFSTAFWFNIFISITLYLLLFFFSPYISLFYGIEDIKNIIRVMGLTIIISGIRNIQFAYVSRKGFFKEYLYSTIVGLIVSSILSIYFAYIGMEIEALVIQYISNILVSTLVLSIKIEWKPRFVFSIKRLKKLYAFGFNILISRLCETFFSKYKTFIIGKAYSISDLSYYEKGDVLPSAFISGITTSIDNVLFPSMSQESKISNILSKTRKTISLCTYLLTPIMIGMAACSDSIIKLLLTEKWEKSTIFFIVFCISYSIYPIHTATISSLKSLGRSDVYLKSELYKKTIDIIITFISMQYSIYIFALTNIICALVDLCFDIYYNKILLNYDYSQQLKDFGPQVMLSIFMGLIVYQIKFLGLSILNTLIFQMITGLIIYILGSYLLKLEISKSCMKYIKNKFNKLKLLNNK